jgi:hypothetical protein
MFRPVPSLSSPRRRFIPSLVLAAPNRMAAANISLASRFARPLFSRSYEFLFLQTLCFEKYLRCPGCGMCLSRHRSEIGTLSTPATKPFLSDICGLFFALCALLRTPILCFQSLTDSFCKRPGVGYASQIRRLKSMTCGLFFPSRPHFALSVLNSRPSISEAE